MTPHKPGRRSSRPSSTSPQIFNSRLPVALRALASRNGFPCCVRRSRTEVTATINHTSSANGSSGMGILPFIFQLTDKFGDELVETRPNKFVHSRESRLQRSPQLIQFN